MAQIFSGYAEVFSAGPPTLRLSCGPSWELTGNPADQTANKMKWNYVELPRDETVSRLRQIVHAAQTVQAAPSDRFIAIRGI